MEMNMTYETDEEYKTRLAGNLPQGTFYLAEDIRDAYGADLDDLAKAFNLPPRREAGPVKNQITAALLEGSGYRHFPDTAHRDGCLGLYQNVVWSEDEKRKLYFINFSRWDMSRFPGGPAESWSVEVRMHLPKSEFGVEYLIDPTTTLTDVEVFYERVYERMFCIPDKHNN